MPVPNRQPTCSETVNETETNKQKTVIVSEENISYTIRKADKPESNKLTYKPGKISQKNLRPCSVYYNIILLFITKKKKTGRGSLFSNISDISTVHKLRFTSSWCLRYHRVFYFILVLFVCLFSFSIIKWTFSVADRWKKIERFSLAFLFVLKSIVELCLYVLLGLVDVQSKTGDEVLTRVLFGKFAGLRLKVGFCLKTRFSVA